MTKTLYLSQSLLEIYPRNSCEILATSARLRSWLSSRTQMIFPSRSVSSVFDFSKYLSIEFILTILNLGLSNFCKSLIFGYPFAFFIDAMKKLISSSKISFSGLGFFFVNFLDLIIVTISYHIKTVLIWSIKMNV